MPILKDRYTPTQVELEINFVDNDLLDYEKGRNDFLNWIPCEILLRERDEIFRFRRTPTYSVEGIKHFLNEIDKLLDERKEKGVLPLDEHYEKHRCGATEGEFEMILENTHDEELVVSVELWVNTACLEVNSANYFKGVRFSIFLDDLEACLNILKGQLFDLTDGEEGVVSDNGN